ncbi:MAG TPA: hypothetical protein VMT87_10390 [Vicinamibacteria bacterium]|nr:hypothetical protein [Vicinamibacteria bacterium]
MDLLPLRAPAAASGPCAREEALVRLRGRGLGGWYRGWRHGPLCEVRPVQVPYRLFEVRVSNAGRLGRQWLAIDAVAGALDLYAFPEPPGADQWAPDPAAGVLPEGVPGERLRAEVMERVRRQVYSAGFFRLRGLRIEVDDLGRVLYLPYWAGLHRKGGRTRVEVLGGLRRGREGAKVRDLIAPWLAV